MQVEVPNEMDMILFDFGCEGGSSECTIGCWAYTICLVKVQKFLSKGGSLWTGTQLTWGSPWKPLKQNCFLWGQWSVLSSGGLDPVGWLGIEVLPDGIVMYGCSHCNKQVPNGMSERDNAITFEKDHPQAVAGSTNQQLAQPWLLRLGTSTSVKGIMTGKGQKLRRWVTRRECAHHREDDQGRKNSHHGIADQLH